MGQMQIRGNTQIMAGSIGLALLDANTLARINSGIDWKASVKAATTANITLSGTQTIDGVALSVGDRVLVKNQSNDKNNGLYVVASGAWTRTLDADEDTEVTNGLSVWVQSGGTANGNTQWTLVTADPISLGATSLLFTQSSGLGDVVAGNGLTKTGNTLDVVAGNGIVVAADSVSVLLDVDNGLDFTGGGVQLGIKLPANAGLVTDANGLNVNPGDGLELVTNAVKIKLDTNSGLAISGTGTKIKLDSTPGLVLGAGGVKVLLDSNPGLQLTSGLKVIAGPNIVVNGSGVGLSANPSVTTVTLDPGGGSATVIAGDGASGLLIGTGVNQTSLVNTATAQRYLTMPNKTGTLTIVSDFVAEETPSGTINGSNVTFTLANTPVAGTVQVFLNGIRQKYTTHFTVSGTTLTMGDAPTTGDNLIVSYIK